MLGVCSGSSSGDQPALAGYTDRTPGRAELGLHLGLGHAAVRSLDQAVQGLAAAAAAAPRPAAGREGAARRLGRLGGGGVGQRGRHLLASRLPALAAAQRAPLLAELAAPGHQQHEDEEALQGAEQREHVLEGQAGVGDGQVAEDPRQTWQSTEMDISAVWFSFSFNAALRPQSTWTIRDGERVGGGVHDVHLIFHTASELTTVRSFYRGITFKKKRVVFKHMDIRYTILQA